MQNWTFKTAAALTALCLVAACSGGGGGSSISPPPPPPPPPPSSGGYTLGLLGILDGNSGSGQEIGRGIAVDSSGAIYVTGGTSSTNFPVTNGAYDTSLATGGSQLGSEGALDVFVAKFSPQGNLVWSTYLGGPNYDRAYAIQVDSAGDVYVAGRAGPGFPTTAGVVQPNFGGDNNRNSAYGAQDGFVTKLAGDGGSLIWSTYFGGASRGFIRDLDIDAQGRAHVGFIAYSNHPHITNDAARTTRLGVADAGYAVISANGQTVQYATYLGGTTVLPPSGNLPTLTPSVRVRSNGGTYVSYMDNANDVPVTANAYQSSVKGHFDMVVTKFTPQRTVEWTTYLGGSSIDETETHGLAIDANDRPIIAGNTRSKDFPTTQGAYQTSPGSSNNNIADGFISILSADGRSLYASTYFGGNQDDQIEGLSVLPDGTVIATGATFSSFLPTTGSAYQTYNAGGRDGLLAQFSANLSSVPYATYIGGTGDDTLNDVDVNAQGIIGFAGAAGSTPFPTVNSNDMTVDGSRGAMYGRLDTN